MINCTPKSGGEFELENGGQFTPKLVVNLHWNRVINLTGFSTKPFTESKILWASLVIGTPDFAKNYY